MRLHPCFPFFRHSRDEPALKRPLKAVFMAEEIFMTEVGGCQAEFLFHGANNGFRVRIELIFEVPGRGAGNMREPDPLNWRFQSAETLFGYARSDFGAVPAE